MQILASCLRNGLPAAWQSVDAAIMRELFAGRLQFDPNSVPHASFGKALGFPISLTHFSVDAPLTFRRTWQDIRRNKVGVKVIWVIRRGSLQIIGSNGSYVVEASQAGIMDSNVPFHAKILGDKLRVHESFQIIVPPDLFATHLREAENFSHAFALDTPAGHLAQSLLTLLAEKGEQVNRKTAKSLSEALLESIGDNIGTQHENASGRQRLVDRRFLDIEEFIEMNLADPYLSYSKVAERCGISPRYLCHILKANGKSYSELLWRSRLPKARDLLVSSATRNYSIREVAYMSGFKSAAHFSRRFKATYGRPPRKYRAAHGVFEASAFLPEMTAAHD
jgi:AraC family transcriptional regulator, positive regulator of tynA and feaB